MQRYRVNYRLLISLVVGACVAAPAAYGLWRFQVDRNASGLIAKADAAEKAGDMEEVYDSLSQYVLLRPKEEDALIRLGEAAVKLADNPDIEMELRSTSYFGLVETVRQTGDHGLRRKLVDLHMRYGFADRALQAINELFDAGKGDAELNALKVQCLFMTQNANEGVKLGHRLIGFDPRTKEFDPAKAEAPNYPIVYFLLAQHLFANDQADLAEQVINQMVVANPESREAFVFQYQVLKALGRTDEARAALARAYELDPTDAGVLLSKGIEELADYQLATTASEGDESGGDGDAADGDEAAKHLDAAAALFAEGMERYPDRSQFYDYAARTELVRDRYDEAIAIDEKGLKQFPLKTIKNQQGMPVAIDLAMQKIEILFAQNKLDAVQAEIKALRELENPKVDPLADYFAARIEFVNQNWLAAARKFAEVKGRLISAPGLQASASASQGLSHAQLGQWDLAQQAYQWALDKNPNLPLAVAGLEEAKRMLGQTTDDTALQFEEIVKREMELPPAQQDWAKVEGLIDEFVKKQAQMRGGSQTWIDARKELLKAQMLLSRGTAAEDEADKKRLILAAKNAIRAANQLDPTDIAIQLAAPRVLMVESGQGPAEALKLLDDIIARNKADGREETAPFRLLRIDLLFALRDEQVANQLHAATDGMESWQPQQQAQVWAAAGARFEQLGLLPDATLCIEKAANLAPAQLNYRVAMFELARKQADDVAMRAAQEKILDLVKSKTDPDYVLTEVKRLMVAFAANQITKDDLKQARVMLDNAIKQRSTWAELYVLSGQLAMILEEDSAKALKDLDLALENGPTNYNALNLQIRLLAELSQFPEAHERMKLIPEEVWTPLLDRTAANVLRAVGEDEKAFKEARKLAEANAKDPLTQVWFAEIAAAAKKPKDAEAALKAAVDLRPSDPDMWMALLNFYVFNKQSAEVEATLRQSQLELEEDFLMLLTAQQHRLFGRFGLAESILLSSYKGRLDELPIAQRMAEFYLAWGEYDDNVRQSAVARGTPANQVPAGGAARRGQAARYLNRILRAAYDDPKLQSNPTVAWARRQAARYLSLSGDYQDSLKAERLLSAAMEKGAATAEGQDLLIDILNRRGDPASRQRIIALLQQIQQQRGLTPQRELLLGNALNDVGDWPGCLEHLQAAITRYPDDPALRVSLVEKLIDRQEFRAAEQWLTRLNNLPDAAIAIPQLRVRLAAAQDDKTQVRKYLESMTPNLGAMNDQQLQILHAVALMADSVGDHEYALKLITEYARRVPGNELELARFTALYGDLDAGLMMLNQLFPADMDDVLATAIEVLRARRSDDPAKLDEAVNRMARMALRDDPESARRMVFDAETLEVQEKFDEAVAAYNKILDRDDVPEFVRATALNNLAFLLAMKKQDLDQALEGVNEAIEIIGPISDILDTRALVYSHRGDYAAAVKDLQLAVKMGATASKYFHLAAALLGAGDEAAAVQAWEQAELRGLSAEALPDVEIPDFEATQQKIEAIRAKRET